MADSNVMNEKHYGFHRAIVTQNNDPERMGRVKLFFPEFSAHLARYYGLDAAKLEARFAGGKNIQTFLTSEILVLLNSHLPWSDQASPLMGSGTAGLYDAKNNIATVGDGHTGAEFEPLGEDGINPSGEAVSPKASYSIHGNSGLFSQGYKTGKCDPQNELLKPSAINNATKGMFSIPRVGAQVWCFFEGGNILRPVYCGYAYDKNDWNSVTNPQGSNPNLHYPAGSENIPDNEPFYHTGQTTFNSKAGSLEFRDTDDFEMIKISHYSGSYYEISNHHTKDIAMENRTVETSENEFHTVKGDSVFSVAGESHEIYYGKHYITYGDMDTKTIYEEWVETAQPAFSHAAQFEESNIKITNPTTKKPEEKGGPNDEYNQEHRLTFKPKSGSWTSELHKLDPFSWETTSQLNVLNVKKV